MPSMKYALILAAFALLSCSGLDAGWRAQKSGNYSSAQEIAALALAKDPKNPEVYQLIATNYLGQGKFDEAIKAAQFAASLGYNDAKSLAILAQAYEAKKDWAGFCETTEQQLVLGTLRPEAQNVKAYRQALTALADSKRSEAFGCYHYLDDVPGGLDGLQNVEAIPAAHAQRLAQKGLLKEAIAIEEQLQDDDYRYYDVADHLFKLRKDEEAKAKTLDYLKSPALTATERSQRIQRAADLCDKHQQWGFKADLLKDEKTAQAQMQRAVALKKSHQQEASTALLEAFFNDPKQGYEARKEAIAFLLNASLADEAVAAFDASSAHYDQSDWLLSLVIDLDRAGKGQKSKQILQILDEREPANLGLKLQIFDWLYLQRRWPQAQVLAEQALKLGAEGEAFYAKLLTVYGENKQFRLMQRTATQFIDAQASPAADARLIVARNYSRYGDWTRAEESLRFLDEQNALSPDTEAFYIETLQKTQNDARLFALLKAQCEKKTRTPLSMATFFERPESENYFLDSLKPLLDVQNPDRWAAYFAKGRFYGDVMQNPQESDVAIALALDYSDDLPTTYKQIVNFYIDRNRIDNAKTYAEKWIAFDPSARDPHAILGLIKLQSQDFQSSEQDFNRYVDLSPKIYDAMRYVFDEHIRAGAGAQGFKWIKAYHDHLRPEISANDKLEALRAFANAEIAWSHQLLGSDKIAAASLRSQGINDFSKLIELDTVDRAISYARELERLGAYDLALKAYDKGATSPSISVYDKVATVRCSLLAGNSPKDIQNRCERFVDEEDILALATMLEREQALALGRTSIERLLDSDKAATRQLGFIQLNKLAREQADTKLIQAYASKLEASAPNNVDIRSQLLKSAIESEHWEDATRHLNFLQMTRPDARNLIEDSLIIARRAQDNPQAQAIWESIQEAAKGTHHRSLWIAEAHQQYGDYDKALEFYRLAYRHSGASADEIRLKLIDVELLLGHQEEALALVAELRQTPLWNAERIQQIAKQFFQSAYENEVQNLMLEAMRLEPDNTTLKSEDLMMALDSGDIGKINLSLARACSTPVAEVMDGLVDKGAMLDAFDAIDSLEAQGHFDMAAASLLRVQDAYVQARGVFATRQKLLNLKTHAPGAGHEIDKLLAKNELMGQSPCNAITHMTNVTDAELWAKALSLCKTEQNLLWTTLMAVRNTIFVTQRSDFDDLIASELALSRQADLLTLYAQKTGMKAPVASLFQSLIATQNAHQALRYLEENEVPDAIVPELIATLASFGYDHEAIELAQKRFDLAPQGLQRVIGIQGLMLGSQDSRFLAAVNDSNPNDIDDHVLEPLSAQLSDAQIKAWIAKTPTTMMDKVIATAIFSARDPKRRNAILSALNADIDGRPQRASLLFSLAKHAQAQGLDDAALAAIYKIQEALPTSESSYRDASVILERLGRPDEAWEQLKRGEKRSNSRVQFWKHAQEEHAQANVAYRQKINALQRQIETRNPTLALEQLSLLLEIQNHKDANTLALDLGQYKASDVAKIYIEHDALAQIPAVFYEKQSALGYELKARRALSKGEQDVAAAAFAQAAAVSAWPLESYREAIESFISANAWDRVEQFTSLAFDAYPHAYYPYLYRAIIKLETGKTAESLDDIQEALKRELSPGPIFGRYLRAVAEKNQKDLSLKSIAELSKLGTIQDSVMLDWLLPYFANEKNAAKAGQSPAVFANSCIDFLKLAGIDPVYTSQKSPQNLNFIMQIAQNAGDEDLSKRAKRQLNFLY